MTFNDYKLNFITDGSIEDLKTILQSYFNRTLKSNNKNIRFSGLFISDLEFEIRSKWEMNFASKPFKSKPYILGVLSSIDNKSAVQLYVRGKTFKWYMILPLLLPLYLVLSGLFINPNNNTIIAGVLVFFLMIAFIFIAYNVSYDDIISELTDELKQTDDKEKQPLTSYK